MFCTIKSIFLLLFFTCSQCSVFNETKASRREKTFSLFSVVQFPNDVCTTTSGTYTNGTCITSSECSDRGGTTSGTCAAGFGVCCIYTFSSTGDVITQNVSYVVNPSYPSNYAPTSTPATVSYTIQKSSCDVCRLRLDFEDFQLTTPTTADPSGYCSTDYMTIKTTAHQTISPTTGNIGNYPQLCGTNSGQHAYVDMSCSCTDTASLDFVLGDATNNQWKIKTTQLSCDDAEVASTEGCFQYFTAESGSFQSYGFQSSAMICGQNYATCIRPKEGYCCIEYVPVSFNVPSWNPDDGQIATCKADNTDAKDTCNGAIACQRNYVIIPGALSEAMCKNDATFCLLPKNGLERYCGSVFTAEGHVVAAAAPYVNTPVITCQRPFRFFYVSNDCGTPGDSDTTTANSIGVNVDATSPIGGFSFNYRQLPGGC